MFNNTTSARTWTAYTFCLCFRCSVSTANRIGSLWNRSICSYHDNSE